jgi:serine protease AprX
VLALVLAAAMIVGAAPSVLADDDGGATSLHDVARATRATEGRAMELSGEGVQVALIDTGVVDVPGLRPSNVTIGPDFSFDTVDPDLIGRDGHGHGTHLAGIIAASDREWAAGDHRRTPDRVLGLAPDAELISVKVGAANGAVDVTQVIAAIDWVIESNASGSTDIRVINLAYGTDGTQDYRVDPLAYAVERAWHAGIVVVVAAGNDGDPEAPLVNPALDPFVIAVGAAQSGARKNKAEMADYVNGGTPERGVDVVAPGASIVSLRVPESFSDRFNEAGRVGDDLVRATGTSQAAAVVSGAVALLLEARPGLTPDQVKAILIDTATFPGRGDGVEDRAGIVDVAAAVVARIPSDASQRFPVSDGSGSIELARGSIHVTLDAVPLTGERDIFGNDVSHGSWTESSWTGLSWSGSSWTGLSWNGSSWTGLSWNGSSWTGLSWNGSSWTGLGWLAASWS